MARQSVSTRMLAKRTNLPEQILRNKLTGRTRMDEETARIVVAELRMPVSAVQDVRPVSMGNLRILGGVAAGYGWQPSEDESSIPVPLSMCGPNRVGWIVQGDSMLPLLREGDIAIFEAQRVPRLGYPNLIRSDDGNHRVKLVRHDGERYVLSSYNRAYEPEVAKGEWLGYLVGFYRLVGSREEMLHDPSGVRLENSISEPK